MDRERAGGGRGVEHERSRQEGVAKGSVAYNTDEQSLFEMLYPHHDLQLKVSNQIFLNDTSTYDNAALMVKQFR